MAPPDKEIEIIGWHDGITEAFVRKEDGRWIYASMIAWNPDKRLRIFGIVEADNATVSDIRALTSADHADNTPTKAWHRIRIRISDFLQEVKGQAEVWFCEHLDDKTRATLPVDLDEVLTQMGGDVEDSLETNRFALWTDRFSASGILPEGLKAFGPI